MRNSLGRARCCRGIPCTSVTLGGLGKRIVRASQGKIAGTIYEFLVLAGEAGEELGFGCILSGAASAICLGGWKTLI